MADRELPDSLQSMIKDILANDEALRKVKQLDKVQKAKVDSQPKEKSKCEKKVPAKKTQAKFEDNEDVDEEVEPQEEEQPKPKKQKRLTKKQQKDILSKQYLEEVALGKLKFQDANGRNRTTSFKKWINDTKNPKYDENKECWIIPDTDMYKQRVLAMKTCGSLFMKKNECWKIPDHEIYKQRVLAMKTCGSLFMKKNECSLTDMQSAVSYFLKALDEDQYENLADILETPNIAPKILDIMSGYKE